MVSWSGLRKKPFFNILLTLFILWIIFFEFVLPENNFLPKPGIVLLTVPALFEDYHLVANFFTTVSAIYLPPLLTYILMFLFRKQLLLRSGLIFWKYDFISKMAIFIPVFLLGIFLVFWFPHSFFPEYLFSLIISGSWWLIETGAASQNMNETYKIAFQSFGADNEFINKHITWFEMLPSIFSKLPRFHLHLWGTILAFEFIMDYYGLGAVIRQSLQFHDLSALFLISIIISLVSAAGYAFIKVMENRFIFWGME